jgi:hypothetical protein
MSYSNTFLLSFAATTEKLLSKYECGECPSLKHEILRNSGTDWSKLKIVANEW